MKNIELEVYSDEPNHAVIRPPGRRFPGAVLQGDSLFVLCAEAREISRRLKEVVIADDALLEVAQEHQEKLLGRLLHYQRVLEEHGIDLPYSAAVSRSDLIELVPPESDAP